MPNIIEDRKEELEAIEPLLNAIPSSNIIMLPSDCYAEGGDVIIHDPYVFVGVSSDATFEKFQTARTNTNGFECLQDEFPALEFKSFELFKDDMDPLKGSLHLDCAFQPLGDALLLAPHLFKNHAILPGLKTTLEEIIYFVVHKRKPTNYTLMCLVLLQRRFW